MADRKLTSKLEAMEVEEKNGSPASSVEAEDVELSEDESDEDDKNEELVKDLENKIEENPYTYNNHTSLIALLSSMGELDRLRKARDKMSKLFPLTEELWLSWLRDEIKLVSNEEEREKVNELFEKAVQDYLSVEIWLEWAQFSIGGMGGPGGVEACRTIFERSLTAAGLHVSKGSILWEAFREFENVLLGMLEPSPGAVITDSQNDEYAEQRSKVLQLFKRQLSCPLFDMERIREELREWCNEGEDSIVEPGYQKALEKLKAITPFEEKLLQTEGDEQISAYREYMNYEVNSNEPIRVTMLYERAVSQHALSSLLWLKYVTFVDRYLNVPSVALPVCERALRNVPWEASLWVMVIRAGERHAREHTHMQGLLEQALSAGLSTADDFRCVWEAYIDYLRRRVPWSEPEAKDRVKMIKDMRDCTNRACEHLAQMFGFEGDPQCSLLQAWARTEASHCKNMERSRQLWSDIMSQGHESVAAMWLEYLTLERVHGDSKHLRRLFARALNSTKDWPESIGQAWLSFEREYGTLETFETCADKVQAKMQKVAEERENAAKREKSGGKKGKGDRGRPEVIEKSDKTKHNLKRKMEGTWADRTPVSTTLNTKGASSKGPPPPGFKSAPPPGYKGGSFKSAPPPGFKAPDASMESPESKKSKTEEAMDAETSVVSRRVEHNPSKDNRTVFISNLDYSVSEEDIRGMFGPLGSITDLRQVRDFKGRSKGFCYVEFSAVEEALLALKKDREPLNGRPMFVSKCDPDRETRQTVFKYSTILEKNKLFIKGLPLSMSKDQLTDMYAAFGTLKDVRLVTYRNGHSKGLAYIDFMDEASAAHALIKTDGQILDGHTISVAISNPPERKQTSLITPDIASLGVGPREAGRNKPRMSAPLMPRSVRLTMPQETEGANGDNTASTTSANGKGAPTTTTTAPRTNADFRSLLLGKK